MNIRIFFVALLIMSMPAFSQWKPAEKSLVTRWAREVTPENAWQEYPRPQLVRADWKNLNGLWEYALLKKETPMPASFQGRILVPFCIESSLSGVGKTMGPDDRLWYKRSFEVPGSWAGRRIILNFEAVDWSAGVWINDAFVGAHKGGYDRFSFDITGYLSGSGPQTLVVGVDDPTSWGTQPRGKQQVSQQGIWYTPVSGIWQTVWLEPVSKQAAIKEIEIIPDVDRSAVTVVPMLFEPTHEDYDVSVSVHDGAKQVAQARGKADTAITISLNNPRLWSPNSPFLYDLKLDLVGPGGSVERLDSYFGMRKIGLGDGPHGKVFELNNSPLFHFGPLDQGWWPDGLHTPPSDAAMKYDIQTTKDMGFNMIRKHIKVEPDRWYYWCDKLGIMVWQDMPSGMVVVPNEGAERPHHVQHVPRDGADLKRRSADSAQFEWELRRMMDLRRNAASIVVWVPFNEGWGQYDTCRISQSVKSYDTTRLVIATSGWALRPCGDVYDIHSYDKKVQVPPMFKDRASVVGEYGGIGYPLKEHLWNPEMRNWGYQTYQSAEELLANYIAKFDQIVAMKKNGLSGAVYTQTTDVEGEINGLITYDREVVKIDPQKLKEIHAVLYK